MATVSYKITASNYKTAKTIQCKIGDTISITTSTSYGSSSNDTYGIISMRTTSGNVTLPIISGCSFTVVTSNSYTRINSLSGTISAPGTSTLVMGYLRSTSAYGVKGANLTIIVPYTSTLKYNANGGSGAPSSQSIEHTTTNDQTHRISSTIPTRDGYKFLGWSTDPTATTASYQPRDTISLSYNGSTTLYAVWEEAALSIPVKVSGTWEDSAPKTKVSGEWKDIIKAFMKVSGTWKQHK